MFPSNLLPVQMGQKRLRYLRGGRVYREAIIKKGMVQRGVARSRCFSSTNLSALEDTTKLVPERTWLQGDDLKSADLLL
jgi:hypothetical protein